jgi:hypothetical protein
MHLNKTGPPISLIYITFPENIFRLVQSYIQVLKHSFKPPGKVVFTVTQAKFTPLHMFKSVYMDYEYEQLRIFSD